MNMYSEPEYDKYARLEMWMQCDKCKKWFEVDEPDDYCPCYTASLEDEATQKPE
jgi:hypothetical protein